MAAWKPSAGQKEMGNEDSSFSTLNAFCLTCSTFSHEVPWKMVNAIEIFFNYYFFLKRAAGEI